MYRRILVPVSTPQEVEPLLRFGADLLDPNGELRVLHVIPSVTIPEVTRLWRSSVNIVVPAHEMGAALDVPVEPEVRAGKDVPSEILETAESHSIDAILFTLRGERRARAPFVGHTATALLQHAPCDVLIANRLALTGSQYDKVLLPSLSGAIPPKAMQIAEQVAIRRGAIPLVTLNISVGGHLEEAVAVSSHAPVITPRGVAHQRRRVFLPSRLFVGRHRALSEVILAAAHRERYGLLLVADDPQREEGPILTRRFVEELFRHAPCPVLTVRGG
ncbi:MAG: universal stress protein [Euryarchaeota archaeon]|nr:universal stress protein [Euryarchaeota archaeon]MDE1837674.1 universal stress protein [Euryarchaeota archaeon]MDE1880349.1 universal stress protein [Euryarchaeota archaeon]MDE2046342.1 universal stress protein [Thermoplasmata archaeon]